MHPAARPRARTAFYEYDHPLKDHVLGNYRGRFQSWKQWLHEQAARDKVAPLPDGRTRVDFVADVIRARKGEEAAKQFLALAGRVLAANDQNKTSAYRDDCYAQAGEDR